MADQHKWVVLTEFRERVVQLQIDLGKSPWLRTRTAPRVAGSVICADSGRFGQRRLDQRPLKRERVEAALENDRWRALPGTIDVESVTAKIHDLTTRRRRHIGILGGRDEPRRCEHD